MRQATTVFLGVCLFVGSASVAGAGDFDGSRKLLCVPVEASECGAGAECQRVTVTQINIPQFITVDVKKKQLSGTDADGEKETTAIQNVQKTEEKVILQGAEGRRGWSIVIDRETGKMSAAISDNQAGFVLFGACTTR